MNRLSIEEIREFLTAMVEPLHNPFDGIVYRAAVYLTDGTYLPCVSFRDSKVAVAKAKKVFDPKKLIKKVVSSATEYEYEFNVKQFVTTGNRLSSHYISKVEVSSFAFPKVILQQIQGETRMGWTGFVARMKDNKYFAFGTSWYNDFFEMPSGYIPNDIVEIINHSYIGIEGEIKNYRSSNTSDFQKVQIFKDKPFFECYLDGL